MNLTSNLKISMLLVCLCSTFLISAQQSMNMTLLGTWDGSTVQNNGTYYNDVWGYTDEFDNEYAIVGSPTKVHFLDVTTPATPVEIYSYTGGANSIWRDFKTYKNYVYCVADFGKEGLLIFDLGGLPANPPVLINQIADFDKAHNIFIDVPNGLAYIAGSSTAGNGLMVYDLKTNPSNPTLVFSNSLSGGYVHDVFVQDNIAYASHGYDGFYMYDFSNPSSPQFIDSRLTGGYNHSSWITEDGNHVVYAEEIPKGRPLGILDISDIPNDGIELVRTFKFPLLAPQETNVTPHNPFIIGDYCLVSYYDDGLQIFDISDKNNPSTAAYYDTDPNNTSYAGTENNWGVYPFFPSGNIVATDTEFGVFILSTNLTLPTTCNDGIQNGSELGIDCGGYCKTCPGPPIAGFTEDTSNSCNGEISFTDLSSITTTSWSWDFGDGNTSTQQNPVHNYTNSGTYSVSLVISNSTGSDTLSKLNYLTIVVPDAPSATGADFCAPDAVTLTASTTTGVINWFDDAGNYLTSGSSFTTPTLNTTTAYYVETEEVTLQHVGPVDSNIGSGEYHNTSIKYMLFTVLQDLKLTSVLVNSNQAGNRTINLLDGSGTVINSYTFNIPNGISRITFNADLTPGNYLIGGGNMNLFRNNAGVSYPYTVPDYIEITGSTKGPNHYYYFYDWEIQSTCFSAQTTVTATATPLPVSDFTSTAQGNTILLENNALYTTSWLWSFGDGITSTLPNPTHTYAAPGTYTVTLTATNDCGSRQSSQSISVPQIQVNLTAFLEGAFDSSTGMMDTDLQQRSLFPISGQPYTGLPWNYFGTEGVGWAPSDYPVDAVDWVLVSLRSGEDASTTIGRAAGLLMEDGSVSVGIIPPTGTILSSYYVVLEHRNHLPVMSPTLVSVNNNVVAYDFTSANSYVSTGFGQKNIVGDWVLFAGNADQLGQGHEITGSDIIQWQQLNGNFNVYKESDYSLNGDINADDKILWFTNNGIYSSVPK